MKKEKIVVRLGIYYLVYAFAALALLRFIQVNSNKINQFGELLSRPVDWVSLVLGSIFVIVAFYLLTVWLIRTAKNGSRAIILQEVLIFILMFETVAMLRSMLSNLNIFSLTHLSPTSYFRYPHLHDDFAWMLLIPLTTFFIVKSLPYFKKLRAEESA